MATEQAKKVMIGKYEIISQLVKGGMGATYKAKHPVLDRFVVLKKLLLKGSKIYISRFKREARLMIDFNNDYIVNVYDIFKEGSSYYIAIEYVDGVSLADLIRRERYLSNEGALLIFYEVCKALEYVHDKGIVHRDIKPGNILVSKEGEVKLIDFGIATTDDEEDDGLTKEGMTLGTPSYMSPEQIKDSKNVDKRADIYSMGVMLYEMVTGKTPYPGSFSPETITLIQRGKYKDPHKLNPRVVPVIRKIIHKCMYVRKNNRFKDIAAIYPFLHKYLKRREPDFLRNAIKDYINGKDVKSIYKHAPSFLRFFAKAALLAVIVFGSLFFTIQQGFHYEYLMGKDYGAVQLTVRVNREYKEPQEVFAEGKLYKENKDFPEELQAPELRFTWQQDLDTKNYFILQAPKFYLKSGFYRLNLNVEGKQYWQSFFLKPRVLQSETKDSVVAMPLTVTYNPDMRQAFDIRPRILDSVSGRDITAGTDVDIMWGGRYETLTSAISEQLKTGIVYEFQVTHDNYYPQYYKFSLKPFQDVAELNINLVPIPGYLVLSSLSNNLRVSLNNSNHYLTGGLERIYQELQPLQKNKDQKLILAPGEYGLTIERSKTESRTIRITINSDATVTIKAEYGEKDKNINLAVN